MPNINRGGGLRCRQLRSLWLLQLIVFIVILVNVELSYGSVCNKSQRMCENGDCIAERDFCDGHADCSDSSDEGDICKCPESKFPETIYPCREENGVEKCIFKIQECDGIKDCPGGDDEYFCIHSRFLIAIK